MNRDIICECLDKEHFCDTCPNKDGSECPVFGCVYSHALSMLKDDEVEIWKLKAELKKYEQAEADGLLVRLPCKVGDTVYYTQEQYSGKCIVKPCTVSEIQWDRWLRVYGIEERQNSQCFYADDFGKTVFLTREEAKKALKEAQT